jgi:predicted amidohydrolase YtcJ
VARLFHQEHRLGSIEVDKIANMTVFDCDFLHADIEKVAQANIVATIVDGVEHGDRCLSYLHHTLLLQ